MPTYIAKSTFMGLVTRGKFWKVLTPWVIEVDLDIRTVYITNQKWYFVKIKETFTCNETHVKIEEFLFGADLHIQTHKGLYSVIGISKYKAEIIRGLITNPNPTLPGESEIDKLLKLISANLQKYASDLQKFITDTLRDLMSELSVKIASRKVIKAIEQIPDKNPTYSILIPAISKSTSYFLKNQIPVDQFIKRFFQKINYERKKVTPQKTDHQIAEETFNEFIKKK